HADEYHQLARMVYQEVKRINRSIENFLKFARPQPLSTELFQLDDFFEGLVKHYSRMLKENNIDLLLELQWTGTVKWDREKIKQVFSNLIQNAVDAFTGPGVIEISVLKIPEDSIEITLKDNGPGIPEEILKKIFNLYFTTKDKGTGIGLSIVQQIVDLHNGVISLDSAPGRGTQFLIRLPVQVDHPHRNSRN
ncbi:MAG: sensor histidine kinase, partial [Calditrichaeota bacterium]